MIPYNTSLVSKVTQVSKRKLDYWDKTGLIKPSIKKAKGYGSRRIYSFRDMIQLKIAKELRDKGISLQKIRKALNYLKKHMPEIEKPLAQLRFITDGNSIYVLTKEDKEIIDTLKGGQIILFIAIGEIVNDLRGRVDLLSLPKRYEVNVKGKTYKVILRPDLEDGGFIVGCPSLPGCLSQGETVEEAISMIQDAIEAYQEVAEEYKREKNITWKAV